MTYNNLTGHVIANIDYHMKQTDDSSQVEEHAKINYDLFMSSGTGIAQANEVWYGTRTFNITDSVNIGTLSQQRLGQTFNTSFIGIGDTGNIKGFKVDNLSNESLYINLPFGQCNGNFKLAPSGSITLSNANGWVISAGSTIISISGDTSNSKTYNLGLIGVASPAILNLDQFLNYEYLASGEASITGALLIDYIASSIYTGILEIEYLADQSSIINSGLLNIEYLSDLFFGAIGTGTGIGSGTGTMLPIEYINSFSGFDGLLNIEYSGYAGVTGVNGSGTFELLQNPTFIANCVTCENFVPKTDIDVPGSLPCESGVNTVLGYPGWQASGDFLSLTVRGNNSFSLGVARYIDLDLTSPVGSPTFGKCICPLNVPNNQYLYSGLYYLQECYIKQTVNVIPGAEYRFEWVPTRLETPSSSVNGYPTVKMIAGNGTELHVRTVTPPLFDINKFTLVWLTAVAIDNKMTIEFRVPADAQLPGVPSFITDRMDWGGTTQTNGRVSLYRIA